MKGKFCEKCMSEMQEELQGVHAKIAEQRQADKGHGMYSKDLKKTSSVDKLRNAN